MKTTIIKYGFFALLTGAIVFLAALVFGADLSETGKVILGYASMVVSLSFVFFGIKHYRDNENNGLITFRTAFIIGSFISLFAGVGFAIIDYIYTAIIDPNWIADYVQRQRDLGVVDVDTSHTSGSLAVFMFLIVMVMGLIISILSALILQRK